MDGQVTSYTIWRSASSWNFIKGLKGSFTCCGPFGRLQWPKFLAFGHFSKTNGHCYSVLSITVSICDAGGHNRLSSDNVIRIHWFQCDHHLLPVLELFYGKIRKVCVNSAKIWFWQLSVKEQAVGWKICTPDATMRPTYFVLPKIQSDSLNRGHRNLLTFIEGHVFIIHFPLLLLPVKVLTNVILLVTPASYRVQTEQPSKYGLI